MKKAPAQEAALRKNFPTSGHQKSSSGILPQSLYVLYSVLCAWSRFPAHPCSPCFPLHYNYTFGCTGFSVKSFHGVLDSILQRSVVSSNSSFTSASPGFLHFLYTIIIHIAALDFRRKVSKHQNWASTRLSYLEAKDEITGSLFHSLVAVTLKNILPAIGKDRAQRIIHPNVKVKAFQKEKQVMVSACRLQF